MVPFTHEKDMTVHTIGSVHIQSIIGQVPPVANKEDGIFLGRGGEGFGDPTGDLPTVSFGTPGSPFLGLFQENRGI